MTDRPDLPENPSGRPDDVVGRPDTVEDVAYARIRATEEFHELKRRYLKFIIPMTVAFMAWYLLYVVCSNWAPGLMNYQLFGNINVALVWGLLQFVTTFAIAYKYSTFAIKKLDPISIQLRAEYDEEIR